MTTDLATVEKVGQSSDESGLLARIVAQPTDELGRLVYADWLEERSDPRGQLLRVYPGSHAAFFMGFRG